jgi:hypothetical protein
MRNFVFGAILTSYRKLTYDLCFLTQFSRFQKRKFYVDQVAYNNIVTIRIDIFKFHVTIISNLVFSSYTYLLLFEPLKNENKGFLDFWIFFNGFATQFPNT